MIKWQMLRFISCCLNDNNSVMDIKNGNIAGSGYIPFWSFLWRTRRSVSLFTKHKLEIIKLNDIQAKHKNIFMTKNVLKI